MIGPLRASSSGDSSPRQRGALLVGLVVLGFPGDAHAYLDAGTGSMLLQAMVAGVAAGMVLLRQYRAKIKAFLGRVSPAPSEDSEDDDR